MNCPTCRAAVPEAALEVRDVVVVLAPPPVRESGLLAWAAVVVGPVRIDGLTVRVTTGASISITWPMRKSERGRLHAVAYVLDDELRVRVEAAVISAYVRTLAAKGAS